ncbi:hypothetical protein HDV63DRAFT_385045 [Trichoderma sp. SZMC 28014]
MTGWQVSRFDILTSAASENSDLLFANGRMQVLVNVQIKANLTDENATPYTLSQNELDSIRLIDYFTHAEIASQGAGWVWSRQRGEFAGSLHSQGRSDWKPNTPSQLVQFYVSTTISEKKTIAASIRQSDGTMIRTSDDSYNHSIVLKAQPAINYTYPENVDFGPQRTGDGHYRIRSKVFDESSFRWGQTNYYLTTKDYPLLYSTDDCSTFAGADAGTYSDVHLDSCYACQVRDGELSLSLFFLWKDPLGTTASTRKVGLTSTVPGDFFMGPWTANAFADITVNDKKNSVCFSYVNFHDVPTLAYGLWSTTWYSEPKLTVYDIHGNRGTFKVSFSKKDKDAVVIYNDNEN